LPSAKLRDKDNKLLIDLSSLTKMHSDLYSVKAQLVSKDNELMKDNDMFKKKILDL
jgi:hypothetical protein